MAKEPEMALLRGTATSGPLILAGLNADGTSVSWFERAWPFFSWAIFLFGAGILTGTAYYRGRDAHWYGWLAVVAYCLHQSEEHAFDVRGWRYAFVPYFNLGPIATVFDDVCADRLDGNDQDYAVEVGCPLDPKLTLYVNVVLIWIGFGGCMIAATLAPNRFLFAGSLNWGTAVVNGLVGHVVPAVLTSSYNPGFVQSFFMVPLGLYVIRRTDRPGLCIMYGIFLHAALIGGVKVVFRFRTSEALTMTAVMLFAGLVVPLVVSNYLYENNTKRRKTPYDK